MKLNYIFLSLLCFFLGSCANVHQNVADGSPSAKIRFLDTTGGGFNNRYISSFKNESCEDLKGIGVLSGYAIANTHRQTLGMPLGELIDPKLKTEISVQPGPFIYWIGTEVGGVYFNGVYLKAKRCGVSQAFTAKKDHLYEVTFEITPDEQCISKVYELIQGENSLYHRELENTTHPTATPCPIQQ